MLVISPDTYKVYSSDAYQHFEDEMLQHMSTYSPALSRVLGEDGLRRAVQHGMERADTHGFTLRGPIQSFLEIVFVFGSAFDKDPQYPFLCEALAFDGYGGEMARAEALGDAANHYLKIAHGPDNIHVWQALTRLEHIVKGELAIPRKGFAQYCRRLVRQIHPEKVQFVGEPAIENLCAYADEIAAKHKFDTDRSRMLTTILCLAFGSGCFDDPLYPWIGRMFNNESLPQGKARSDRLERKALTWLDHVLAMKPAQVLL